MHQLRVAVEEDAVVAALVVSVAVDALPVAPVRPVPTEHSGLPEENPRGDVAHLLARVLITEILSCGVGCEGIPTGPEAVDPGREPVVRLRPEGYVVGT